MNNESITKGIQYESLAMQFLQKEGLQLIAKNFHSRFGEIDLIMQDKEELVFVEVRYRSAGLDIATESITYVKQSKLVKTAYFYLTKIKNDTACRFDAVIVDKAGNFNWLKNIITL